MEKDECRSLSKSICLKFARDQVLRAQQLLERFRLCDCPEVGGFECHCVSEEVMETIRNKSYKERSAQTEENNGLTPLKSTLFHRSDSSSAVDLRDAPPKFNRERNVASVARNYLPDDQAYDGIKNPYVLVINNVNFYNDPRPRNGARHDLDNLKRFMKEAGFRSVEERIYYDLRKSQMLDILELTRLNGALAEHDSFICIIMSHGNEEGILGIDSQAIPVDDITAKFQGGDQCPQLVAKPKLFFLQACRGDVDDKGYYVPRGPSSEDVYADSDNFQEMPVKLPSDADFLIAYSTTKGYVSHRRFTDSARTAAAYGESLGSWFISCLVQVLRANSHKEDLMTMLTRVNKAMSEFYTERGAKQISCQLSMLTKKVYFASFFNKNAAVAAV